MSGGDDDRSYLDRDKLSYSERDKLRREGGSSHDRPRGPVAQQRSDQATKEYVKQIDGLFSTGQGGAEGERLARAMRDAHGSPGLAAACREYRGALGVPDDASLLSLFLDTGDPELVVAGLEALKLLCAAGEASLPRGIRSQLRILAGDPDDTVAETAEELLEAI